MPAPAVRRRSARSCTRTRQPRCASAQAAVSPAKPPPTISALPFISARIPDHARRAHREVPRQAVENHLVSRERQRAGAPADARHRLELGGVALPAPEAPRAPPPPPGCAPPLGNGFSVGGDAPRERPFGRGARAFSAGGPPRRGAGRGNPPLARWH